MKHDIITDAKKSISGAVHTDRRHDSAEKHVTGRAEYCDDIAEPQGTLPRLSRHVHGCPRG